MAGDEKAFQKREFSFVLRDDVYMRFLSFKGLDDMREETLRLCPYKIDIGAVYTAKVRSFCRSDLCGFHIPHRKPRERKNIKPAAFQPVEKELVFDIDMTDYDEIRTCCRSWHLPHSGSHRE